MSHLLDRPLWSALTSGWAHLAEGDDRAWRLNRDYGLFGVPADGSAESLAALGALAPEDGALWVVDDRPCEPPRGTRLATPPEPLVQMLCEAPGPAIQPDFEIVSLAEQDAAAMYDLATLTKPGPYVAHTNRLGDFVGVRHDGQLIAMAGERMRMPGFTEISGVCTHPDHRGRGLAGALIRTMVTRMIAKGETPFLHANASHKKTIALYETLGFRLRATMIVSVVVRA